MESASSCEAVGVLHALHYSSFGIKRERNADLPLGRLNRTLEDILHKRCDRGSRASQVSKFEHE
jgi:hypothetical protein